MTRPRVRMRRPPEGRDAQARYTRWISAMLATWAERVQALAADGIDRAELERAWAHLTQRDHVAPMLYRLARDVEDELARYYRGLFKRPPPVPPAPAQARERWVDEQFKLLADLGADQIDRLLAAQAELRARGDGRTDARPRAQVREINKARKANVALIGGTDLRQHTQLVKLFKSAQEQGVRHETLPEAIQEIMGIGSRRAKLIARDQTVKHNAASNEAQARASGLVEYIWRSTPDESTRPMHRALNGQRFRYDSPPVTNENGDRNNPGEDHNCRCQAEPVLTNEQDLFAGLAMPAFEGLGFGPK